MNLEWYFFFHVKRQGNHPAHILAQYAKNVVSYVTWIEENLHMVDLVVTPQTPKGPKHERDVLSTCKFVFFDNSIHIILIKCQRQEIS